MAEDYRHFGFVGGCWEGRGDAKEAVRFDVGGEGHAAASRAGICTGLPLSLEIDTGFRGLK